MNLIKPKKLKVGDTIAIIAPCGNVDFDKIILSKKYFENLGYKVKLGKNIANSSRYMAGNDTERVTDLHEAFCDSEVNAIICARGGYGALRLVDKIDYSIIRENPKIFCGYSDVTILNLMFLKRAGLITFSAPMAQSDFSGTVDTWTKTSFFNTLSSGNLNIQSKNGKFYNSGNASGLLLGGNLATVASLCGLDFLPDEKFIFFVEDLNEPVYKIDRYFTQLLNYSSFSNNVSAILIGDFLDLDDKDYFDELLREISERLNIPVISGYPFSHSKVKATAPVGANAKLENEILLANGFMV